MKTGYPSKVGLYTSPYIKHVRERIQINFKPISEEAFAKYFFRTWDKIASEDVLDPKDRPRYFRYLTLMSFNIFFEERVNVAIYKAGVNKENNAINIIGKLVVTGITGLKIDYKKTLRVAPQLRPTYFIIKVEEG